MLAHDPLGCGPPVFGPDGRIYPRLPGFTRWICADDDFCGSINLRWQPGTDDLPAHVPGHMGYGIVPWRRGEGTATAALAAMLELAWAQGLTQVELTTSRDNVASQRVIGKCGGVWIGSWLRPGGHGVEHRFLIRRGAAQRVHEPTTARLKLRQWLPSDREPFAALNVDAEVMEHFPGTWDRARSDALVARCEALIAEKGWGFWAVEVRESREFIGFVGLHELTAPFHFCPCVEVGWRLARAHWGRGYATEAARAALALAWDVLGLSEVVAFTAMTNMRSQRVMERLGMERAEAFEHPAIDVGHPLRPHVLYRIRRG